MRVLSGDCLPSLAGERKVESHRLNRVQGLFNIFSVLFSLCILFQSGISWYTFLTFSCCEADAEVSQETVYPGALGMFKPVELPAMKQEPACTGKPPRERGRVCHVDEPTG